jgi:GT2 family glycosyltransferase/glycosyltransferase involved in cell wall biosynthesis
MHHLGINVIEGKENGQIFPERVSLGDLVVIQRDFARDFRNYEKILKQAHLLNKPIIYDLDDLLFQLPDNHPDRQSQHYTESLLPILQTITDADCITVTTPNLKNKVELFNNNVFVLPNYFDDTLWKFKSPTNKQKIDKPIIIGYMGTESHEEDISFISPVLVDLLNLYTNEIEIHFWGAKPPNQLLEFVSVKWYPSLTYNYIDFTNFFQKQDADIFIAPLIDNQFNRAKSPLKFFEYSALGAPTVFSNLDPFFNIITNEHNGLLATNHGEWFNKLALLIDNHDLRKEIAANAQQSIVGNLLLSKNANKWKEIYEKFINQKEFQSTVNSTFSILIKSLNYQYSSLIEKFKEDNIDKDKTIQAYSLELNEIKNSKLWRIVLVLRKLRYFLFPLNSKREKIAKHIFYFILGQRSKVFNRRKKAIFSDVLEVKRKINCHSLKQHKERIDIIVCVHNALEDIKICLESIKKYTTEPYSLIIVDDGSDNPTKTFLENSRNNFTDYQLIRNEGAKGYTFAANMGMKASDAPYLILLNSDTIVSPEWIDRLYRAITLEDNIGIIGPLSNTASWQSVPELSTNGDWSLNPLPFNLTAEKMSKLVTKYSGCVLPDVPLLNGFCLMIKKAVIDQIGFFDEDNFGQGYGEEDDFTIRAEKNGWKKVIADDVYIYHSQSKSYSNEKRYRLSKISGENLQKKHGIDFIQSSVSFMNPNRVMEGIRSRTKVMVEREELIEKGKSRFLGKRVLFLLPVADAGGGANVIIDEARLMLQMGVEVKIFNLSEYKFGFNQSYPNLDIPTIFGDVKDLPNVAKNFDAIIASANYSVEWLKPLQHISDLRQGYYIQGFEPLMYPDGSEQARKAIDTYTMFPEMKNFSKTEWTRKMVFEKTGADVNKVGISVNIDLFRPRDSIPFGVKPVTIVAMIRPNSPYRNPEMTLSILSNISKKYVKDVDILLFGSNDVRSVVNQRYLDFNWRQLGKLSQFQVAAMMSKADIFTDFSSHQAMGLSALEAMAAGCSVIVPKNGGAIEFIKHRKNGIVVDTFDFHDSLNGLSELIENDELRKQLQIDGIRDVVQYFPEKCSYNILDVLFK